jgi:hypothetical protein
MQEISVVVDDRLVAYVDKRESMKTISAAKAALEAAKNARTEATKDKRRSDDRLQGFRTLMTRVLTRLSPSGTEWTVQMADTDLKELRALLEL